MNVDWEYNLQSDRRMFLSTKFFVYLDAPLQRRNFNFENDVIEFHFKLVKNKVSRKLCYRQTERN